MPHQIRFPSGATLSQVKKDAKAFKRERNIPHHEALDAAVRQHGFNLDWNDIQSLLTRGGEFVKIPFQCNVSLSLSMLRPAGFVVGPTGCDKTSIAAEMCVNVLKDGGKVVHLMYDYYGYSTIPGYIGDAMGSSSKNVPGFTRHTIDGREPLTKVLASVAPLPGTLIVLEEPQVIAGFDTKSLCDACIQWQVGFIGLVQHTEVISNIEESRVSFMIDASDLNGPGNTLKIDQAEGRSKTHSMRLKAMQVYRSLFHTFAVLINRPH
ncbi:hypothetical protein [Pseudomonas sp. MWU12-2323]|uniref:hypothetical protein n=1 Tax=Pseudomonas sp. MWU12-2323 TaxID=2651296 RepID=UPI00128BB716|nr:hypothetical protein [Pseudomonas sp. MWU12-2323]MPQ69440.1 hypothetical protein [Pseudomonas sp. MWU12-2323]